MTYFEHSAFRRSIAPVLGTLFVLLLAAPVVAQDGDDSAGEHDLWVERAPSTEGIEALESPYAELAETVGPAVVNILVSYDGGQLPPHARPSGSGPIPESLAEGSGFIIHPDGYVVTNFHVIDRASEVTVILDDGSEFEAEVIGGDPMTDIALLQIESDDDLPTVPLGDSASIRVGDYVVAIGNPLGLSHSVTAGIVSALDRRDLPIEGQTHQGNFIQTDAPINPGNSGGPLLNMSGEVIGINAAINRQGQGISFAIPVNLLKTLLPQLKDRGYVVRSWLGVRVQPLDPLLARSFDLGDNRGALVTEVLDESPASRAGIEPRDVIVGVDGTDLDDSADLPLVISTIPEGSAIVIEVLRDGKRVELEVELESLPDQSPPDLPGSSQASTGSDADQSDEDEEGAGVEVTAMTSTLSRQLRAPEDKGVVVTSITDTSPARGAGLEHRDVILQVGNVDVDSEQDFYQAVLDVASDDVIRLKVLRNGRSVYMAFTL